MRPKETTGPVFARPTKDLCVYIQVRTNLCVNANSEFRSTIYLSDPPWNRTFSNYVYTQNVVVGILQSRRIIKEQVQLYSYTAAAPLLDLVSVAGTRTVSVM